MEDDSSVSDGATAALAPSLALSLVTLAAAAAAAAGGPTDWLFAAIALVGSRSIVDVAARSLKRRIPNAQAAGRLAAVAVRMAMTAAFAVTVAATVVMRWKLMFRATCRCISTAPECDG